MCRNKRCVSFSAPARWKIGRRQTISSTASLSTYKSIPHLNDFIDFFCSLYIIVYTSARWFIRNLTSTTSMKLVERAKKEFFLLDSLSNKQKTMFVNLCNDFPLIQWLENCHCAASTATKFMQSVCEKGKIPNIVCSLPELFVLIRMNIINREPAPITSPLREVLEYITPTSCHRLFNYDLLYE